MKLRVVASVLMLTLFGCDNANQNKQTEQVNTASKIESVIADSIYVNGQFYTVDSQKPWASAIAIKDGKYLAVGKEENLSEYIGDKTEKVDLHGAFAMPGLIDVHTHPLTTGIDWSNLSFSQPDNLAAMLVEIEKFAADNPDLPLIRGGSWNLGVFENDSPTKDLLDKIVPDRPVYLISQTGHSAWVNSKALEMAGITKDTEQTETFIFDVDAATGEPSGTVREFGMAGVIQKLPTFSPESIAVAQQRIFKQFNQNGFTTVKAAEGDEAVIKAANLLDKQDKLTMRIFPSWDWRSHYQPVAIEQQRKEISNWREYETQLVKPNTVKMFFDGGPDSYTAMLSEDYEGRPGHKGGPTMPLAQFEEELLGFSKQGLNVIVHVIGDAGGEAVASMFKRIRSELGENTPNLHFSHAWMTQEKEFATMAALDNTCIDFSPALAYPHPAIEGSMAGPVGERYQSFYKVKSAFETYETIAKDRIAIGFGSDWPSSLIGEPNGFHQMQAWITRIDPEKPNDPALNPSEGISLEQAIYGFTQGGAHCLGNDWDDKLGSISTGKYADFIVLENNPFENDITKLWQTKVTKTVVNGTEVFQR